MQDLAAQGASEYCLEAIGDYSYRQTDHKIWLLKRPRDVILPMLYALEPASGFEPDSDLQEIVCRNLLTLYEPNPSDVLSVAADKVFKYEEYSRRLVLGLQYALGNDGLKEKPWSECLKIL